ncbi:MAG: tail fiber domain-containing protein [Candidatus Margulisiibacteriota bacterium]
MKKLMMAVVVLFVALVVASPGWAVPQKINFQGVFKKGAPTGSQTVVFRINSWSESYTATELNIDEKGFFSVQLGSKTALLLPEYAVVTVEVNGTALPGQALTAAPYAITAGHVISRNPNNDNASVSLGWWNDVARIRTGGTGVGAGNGLDIQGYSDLSKLRVTNVGVGVMTPEVTTGYECDINGDLLVRGNMNVQGAITGVTSSPAFTISTDPADYFYIGKPWSGVFERKAGAGTPTFTWTVSIEPAVTGINPSALTVSTGPTATQRAQLNGSVALTATEGWRKLTVRMKDFYNQVAVEERNIMVKKQPVTLHKIINVMKASAGIADFSVTMQASGGVPDYLWNLRGTVTAYHVPDGGYLPLPPITVAVSDVIFGPTTGQIVFTTMVPSTGATVVNVPVRVVDQVSSSAEGDVKIWVTKGSFKIELPEFMQSVEKIDPAGPVTDPGDPVGSDVEDRVALAEHVMGMSGNAASDWTYTSKSGVTTTYRLKAGSSLQKLATNMSKVQNLSGDFLTTVALDGYAKTDLSNVSAVPASKVSGLLSFSQVAPSGTALPSAGTGYTGNYSLGSFFNLTAPSGSYGAGLYQNVVGGSWHKVASDFDLTFTKLQASAGLGTIAQRNTIATADIAASAVTDAKIASGITASKLTGALPAISGANLTSLNAANITTGTIADARLTNNVFKTQYINDLAVGTKKNLVLLPETNGGQAPGIWIADNTAGTTYSALFAHFPATVNYPATTALGVRGSSGWKAAYQINNNTGRMKAPLLTADEITYGTSIGKYSYSTVGIVFSDMRLKSDIAPLSGSLNRVAALQGVSYKWKDAGAKGLPGTTQLGLIAQEIEKVAPELVSEGPDGYKAVNYNGFSALFVEAIKELKAENEALKARIKALEDKSAK